MSSILDVVVIDFVDIVDSIDNIDDENVTGIVDQWSVVFNILPYSYFVSIVFDSLNSCTKSMQTISISRMANMKNMLLRKKMLFLEKKYSDCHYLISSMGEGGEALMALQ